MSPERLIGWALALLVIVFVLWFLMRLVERV